MHNIINRINARLKILETIPQICKIKLIKLKIRGHIIYVMGIWPIHIPIKKYQFNIATIIAVYIFIFLDCIRLETCAGGNSIVG
jgi:hypothetical protein